MCPLRSWTLLGFFLLALPARAEVLVGFAAPLSGTDGWMGAESRVGVQLALEDLNGAGGVLGEPVRLVEVDDNCDGEQAVVAARRLVAAGVVAVIGHQCSGAAIPASLVYAERGIPLISGGATNTSLTERGLLNVFRVCGRDDTQGVLLTAYLVRRAAVGGIAVVHDMRTYGQGLADVVRQDLATRDVAPVLVATVDPGQLDFGPLVAQLQISGAATLLFAGYAPEGGLLFRQLRDAGFTGALVAGDGIDNEAFWLTAGEAANGVLMTSTIGIDAVPAARPLIERARPSGNVNVNGYVALRVWGDAARRAGSAAPAAVIAALRANPFDTVFGRLGFDAKGDVTGIETFAWYSWADGRPARIEAPVTE